MKKRLMVLAGAFLLGLSVYSQSGEKIVKAKLGDYFSDYQKMCIRDRPYFLKSYVPKVAVGDAYPHSLSSLFEGRNTYHLFVQSQKTESLQR